MEQYVDLTASQKENDIQDFLNRHNVDSNMPVQVKWLDYDGDHWCAGILVSNHIICACCGGIVELEDLYDEAKDAGRRFDEVLVIFHEWIDFTSEIND